MDDSDNALDAGGTSSRQSKVSRVIDEYELAEMGDFLARRWTTDDDERLSLRELADEFNEVLLEAALNDADVRSLEGDTENVLRVLTDSDVSSGDRTRAIRALERDGIDVDKLKDDFVSYQAIRTYLQNERGVSYERPQTDAVKKVRETVDNLRGRAIAVVDDRIEQLKEQDKLSPGSHSATVDVRIRCDDCWKQYLLTKLLERGRCDCVE